MQVYDSIVGINTIITSILFRVPPSEVKFVLIDPKKLELSLYAKLKDHYFQTYFDEYDLDLGYPTSSPHKIKSSGDDCVYVRFFDNGAAIINVKGEPVTISDGDLAGLSGYNGPYFRFRGGQDPAWNNGEQFTSLNFDGKRLNGGPGNFGDAIILLNARKTILTEIIIDNIEIVTSPGSSPVELVGGWAQESNDCVRDSWSHGCFHWLGGHQFAYVGSGSGDSYAVFRPKISIAGNYEIYEWHGSTSFGQASNIPYEIQHASGKATGTINQSTGAGKWNYVGTFSLNAGAENYVKISNNANGYVIADAFKFLNIDFPNQGASRDSIPPNNPGGLYCSNKNEHSIELSWTAPSAASDGNLASSYEIYQNNSLIGSSITTTFTDNGLTENTTYNYSVYALDGSLNKSNSPATGSFSTMPDNAPPMIVSVQCLNPTLVEVAFNESVESNSAENIGNYSINNGITIYFVTLANDKVQLTTSTHEAGNAYAITINNIKDLASNQNVILSNSTGNYMGGANPIEISISVDDEYELYVNGSLVGSNTSWNDAEKYTISSSLNKNVIAVKGMDKNGEAGLVAEIDFGSNHYVSDESWKISTNKENGWEGAGFNDISWHKATSYGLHGSTNPWSNFGDVDGISKNSNVKWIWSSEQMNDDVVYFRFSFSLSDMVPPDPPTGVTIRNP